MKTQIPKYESDLPVRVREIVKQFNMVIDSSSGELYGCKLPKEIENHLFCWGYRALRDNSMSKAVYGIPMLTMQEEMLMAKGSPLWVVLAARMCPRLRVDGKYLIVVLGLNSECEQLLTANGWQKDNVQLGAGIQLRYCLPNY